MRQKHRHRYRHRLYRSCCAKPCRYLDLGSYAEWDEEKRIEFLTRELEGKRPLIPTAMPMTNDVREVRLQMAYPATA